MGISCTGLAPFLVPAVFRVPLRIPRFALRISRFARLFRLLLGCLRLLALLVRRCRPAAHLGVAVRVSPAVAARRRRVDEDEEGCCRRGDGAAGEEEDEEGDVAAAAAAAAVDEMLVLRAPRARDARVRPEMCAALMV